MEIVELSDGALPVFVAGLFLIVAAGWLLIVRYRPLTRAPSAHGLPRRRVRCNVVHMLDRLRFSVRGRLRLVPALPRAQACFVAVGVGEDPETRGGSS